MKHEGCTTQPTFNKPGEKTAIFCSKHKKDGMVNVKFKTCQHEGCTTGPTFNKPGEKIAIFCSKHKKEGMVDITHKTCQHEGCTTQPTFNKPGEKIAIFCSKHKKDGMINVISKTCNNEWCNIQVTEKFEGYCLYCYVNMFPEKPITRNYKTKERAVVEFIKSEFPNIDIVSDKKILNGCSKRRPDIFIDLGYQIVIIEIDENQHIDYDCSCENKRLMELSKDVGHCPIVFIRFNPDDYFKNNDKITSCWGWMVVVYHVLNQIKKRMG